jgi:hypothetical protein
MGGTYGRFLAGEMIKAMGENNGERLPKIKKG